MADSVFLFPLQTVLFPDGILTLKVFEQRYLEMTKRCLRDGQPFGVCLIREGLEVGTPAVPERTGCLARIAHWDMPTPGLFHLRAHGEARFSVVSTRTQPNGLIEAEIELRPAAVTQPAVDPLCRDVLSEILRQVGDQHFFAGPVALDDPAWVSFRLAECLPLDTRTKQRVLEVDEPGPRLSLLREEMDRLGIGAHPASSGVIQ